MISVLENLRSFFNSRPPLVVFMICLASFAVALITLAYFVKTKDIPDTDIKEDWNTFLEKFSKMDLCFSQNTSEPGFFANSSRTKLPTTSLSRGEVYQTLQEKFKEVDLSRAIRFLKASSGDEVKQTNTASPSKHSRIAETKPIGFSSVSPTTGSNAQIRNISFVLNVEIVLSGDKVSNIPWTDTKFVTIIPGHSLHLRGGLADAEFVTVFTFPSNLTSDLCQAWDKAVCVKYLALACVQLQGPAQLFPNTHMPELSEMCPSHPTAASFEGQSLVLMEPAVSGVRAVRPVCKQGSHMSTYFSFDESLTVLLSLHDRSVINLRLMRTSYFLFVMVVTFLCYGMIKGRRSKNKSSHSHITYVEKVPS